MLICVCISINIVYNKIHTLEQLDSYSVSTNRLVYIPLDGGAVSAAEGLSLSTAFLTLLILCLCLSGCSSFLSSGNDDAGLDISFLFGLLDT